MFHFAVENGLNGGVDRVVFLALHGEEGRAECAWPVPLGVPPERARPGVHLRVIADDGYAGPQPDAGVNHGNRPTPRRLGLARL